MKFIGFRQSAVLSGYGFTLKQYSPATALASPIQQVLYMRNHSCSPQRVFYVSGLHISLLLLKVVKFFESFGTNGATCGIQATVWMAGSHSVMQQKIWSVPPSSPA